jgi:FKBP-type peptidyl-prolyl cis-trans isomerase 2
MKVYAVILLLVISLLAFGCVNPPQPQANATLPVISAANGTNATAPALAMKPIPPGASVDVGDLVWVNYTLRVDGKVYDTTNATLAAESGIYNMARKYEPLNFTVEFNKGLITGFILGVIGMEVNGTESFTVDPARGYGLYDPQQVVVVERYYEKNLTEVVPRSFLEEQGINVSGSKGAAYNTPYGTVFIQNFTDDTATLVYVLVPGSSFTMNGIPQNVTALSNMTATIEFMLEDGKSYVLPDPRTGQQKLFKVANKTDTNITLDGNSPLANKTLDFTVTLLRAERLQ